MNLVAWTLNQSEARFDLLLIETSLLLFFLKLVPTKEHEKSIINKRKAGRFLSKQGVEVLNFSGFYIRSCRSCVHNCEDHSLLALFKVKHAKRHAKSRSFDDLVTHIQ